MQRQALLRHLGALAQARGDHPPADDRLEREQAGRDGDLPAERALELASPPEPQGGQNERRADNARQQAMRPFPPEDGLEAIERHVRIELGELRDLLVAVELGLPLRAAQRRKNAGDRLPLGDGEAGFGEPRRAANQHHEKDKARHGDQPEANSPAIVKARRLGGGGRGVGYGHGKFESVCAGSPSEDLSPPFVSNMPKAQRGRKMPGAAATCGEAERSADAAERSRQASIGRRSAGARSFRMTISW